MRLIAPRQLKQALYLSEPYSAFISSSRKTICQILQGKDPRLLAIVGPCSIHNIEETLSYARAFKNLQEKFSSSLFLVMRAYIEKPRSLWGWKGLILDPHLNGTYDIKEGLWKARAILLELASLEIPTATEFLTPQLAPYIEDLISWGSIGARTTASQIHRQLASSLPMPIGFKNGIHGEIESAVCSILVAKHPQLFVHIDQEGHACLQKGEGNPAPHLVLRGAQTFTNYSPSQIAEAASLLQSWHLPSRLIVDCSHGNAQGNYANQIDVLTSIQDQILQENNPIVGFMLESYLKSGSQKVFLPSETSIPSSTTLAEGLSITDGCIDMKTTDDLLSSFTFCLQKALVPQVE